MNRTALALCIVASVSMMAMLHQAHAVSDTTVYVESPPAVSVHHTFSVHIRVSPHQPVSGVQCDLTFDPAILQVVSVHDGGMFETWWDLQLEVDNTNGTIRNLVAFNLGGNVTSEEGTMATIVFHPRASGTSFLNLTTVVVSDQEGTALSVTVVNDSVTVAEDTVPPEVTLDIGSPRYGYHITTTTPLSLTVNDASDFILYYHFWNASSGTWYNGSSGDNYSFSLHTEGAHYLEYYARDVYNNSSPVQNVTLHVDTTPPQTDATLDGTQGTNDWYISEVTLTLEATDAGVGGETIYYRNGTTGDFMLYSGPLPYSQEGTTTVGYYAVDALGNAGAEETVTIAIDTVAPTTTATLSGTREGNVYITPVTVSLSPSDAASGIASTRYRVNGGWKTGTSTTLTADGTYTVEYYSKDNAGNEEGVKSITFQILQNQPPTAAFGYTPQQPTTLDTITFDASTSTDADGEIVNYTWNFGDDTAGYGKRPTHQYARTGNYTVTLTVTDDAGSQATAIQNITVLTSLPDLMVTDVRHTTSLWGTDRVVVEIANQGDAPAEGVWCTLKVNGEPSARHYVNSLGSGEHREISFSPQLSFFHRYTLQATADANQSIPEKNEDNNSRTITIFPVSWLLIALVAVGIAAATASVWLIKKRGRKPVEEPRQVRIEPEEDITRCFVCLGKIKPASEYVTCTCGATIHRSCARRMGECPQCGASLTSR